MPKPKKTDEIVGDAIMVRENDSIKAGDAVKYNGRNALVLKVDGNKVNLAAVAESLKEDGVWGRYVSRIHSVDMAEVIK